MKKYIFVFVLTLLIAPCVRGETILQDYYLNNRDYAVMREKINILPNTLRLKLTEGEFGSLRADVTPDAKLCRNLSWRLVGNTGAVEIYPSGETCTVYARTAGEETVQIALDGEKSVNVEVVVTEPKKIQVRSFELEHEETTGKLLGGALYIWVVRSLISIALGAFTAFLILIIKKRRVGK